MGDFENRILHIIGSHPRGIKAKDIAQIMGCGRKNVNSTLYGALKSRCYQDSSYCWHLNSKGNGKGEGEPVITVTPYERLYDICRYYLNCLSLEESSGISAFLKSKFRLTTQSCPALPRIARTKRLLSSLPRCPLTKSCPQISDTLC